ncbi:NAD P-binding protein [Gloeophyllum trabeum ATCC 11539]|uniref:NAD P-binding protein n=1 Tax=Gloeophyllum trabeum (strain ATCC 11539 / FP-39264 / Madison 617) TaxID=670483 RepID=S7PWH3_GLOTA|nr:NAD P-binding protein [Gloeophyllum trabeum ATCC 11539]EPQ51687.1 NAD P-binding protein [Gloeophyllum trabeum ATCC 11539]
MTTLGNFALAGLGRIGQFVAEEFVKLKADGKISRVDILTRRDPAGDETLATLAELGANVKTVDYASHGSLVSALSGIDAVVSVTGGYGEAIQNNIKLADAAKHAGVQLFVPSEWGLYSKGLNQGFYITHAEVHKKLEDIGLPYAMVYCGMWSDAVLSPLFGWDVPNGKVTMWGDGNKPITWTTREDVARFTEHLLTHTPAEQLYWKTFNIEGDRKTLNEIAAEYTARTGKKLDITHRPISEQEKIFAESDPTSMEGILAFILLNWDNGKLDLSKAPGGLANHLWLEWKPTRAVDALLAAYPA